MNKQFYEMDLQEIESLIVLAREALHDDNGEEFKDYLASISRYAKETLESYELDEEE